MQTSLRWSALMTTVALSLFIAGPLRAEDNDLPRYTVLNCGSGCAKTTNPVPIGDHHARFPEFELVLGTQTEGYVELRFTVAADGSVQDPVVEKLIGPDDFARSAVRAVKNWRYQPATANGVAVARPNWETVLIYTFPEDSGARAEVSIAYSRASYLLKGAKYDEAKAVLLPVLAFPRLNFYERSMVSYEMALIDATLKDYLSAREHIEDATIQRGNFLDSRAREDAIRLRIKLEAITGEYGDALAWFELLKETTSTPADDPETKLIAKVQKRLADPAPLVTAGRIPPSGYDNTWDHVVLRRDFAFSNVTGKLDQFQLSCDQQQIASSISEKAEWHVPGNWSNCRLSVSGAPGASFSVYEFSETSDAKK